MKNILSYKHSILILHKILYCNGSVEFVSELINQVKKFNNGISSLELKEETKDYLTFLVVYNFIKLKHGDCIYNKKNLDVFIKILDDNWSKFENENDKDYQLFWYSYLIEYTNNWNKILDELNK